MLKEKRA
jgi:SP family general alpha glucoside:H+ symporter-like MFS transporter